eukprot:TRINITY_DN25876_c0_g1_i1.p1 TRINITY_DN25876_c0_g1~~TRINITY_DN25876_c0_g1_i1.p1  ORF type:complete len:145 (+),score=36.68 TRINITY_DN25876_c0_g1_i1:75-509(+)
MNPRIWRAYRRTLCLARGNLSGEDRAMGVLRVRNAVRLEYLRYASAAPEDQDALIEAHDKVNAFIDWWWRTWEDPLESATFKRDWQEETKLMDEAQAKEHYAKLLGQRVEGMREFNTYLDEILSARPRVPQGGWKDKEPSWMTP